MSSMNTQHGGTSGSAMLISPTTYAALSPQDQQAVLRGLSPQGQQLVRAQIAHQQQMDANRMFMRMSREKTAYCPVTGGSGVTAAWTAGTTLFFDLPTVPGLAKTLLIHFNLTVTPASGAGATYAVTPAAPANVFSELQVLYNGPQIRTHPFFLNIVDQLRGRGFGAQNKILEGNADATATAYLNGPTPITVGSANTWTGTLILRLNPLGNDTLPGCLPLSGTGNKPQLKLTCAPNFLGQDPLLNPIAPTGAGTGHAVTVTGNVNVDVVYLDGTNMDNPGVLQANWASEPTMQYYWDTPLTPFNANTLQYQTIASKLKHHYVVSLIIDGNQASSFAAWSNITGFELSPDQTGQQAFVRWNISNNVNVQDYSEQEVRELIGQDLLPGIIPWVCSPIHGLTNPNNRFGLQWLNMYSGGFPAATHIYQVGSVGGQATIDGIAACTPRVETFLISENLEGLRVA